MVDKCSNYYPTPSQDGCTSNLSRSLSRSASTSNTVPRTPTAKKPKLILDKSDIGIQIGWYGLKYYHSTYKKAAGFKRYIKDIILGDQGSEIKPKSVKHYKEVLDVSGLFIPNHLSSLLRMRHANSRITKAYQWANEHTFLYHVILIL